ncbi:MAG: hypothetical protein AUG49_15040 [Catenulispora sp. 13_1_20CM_3_70_7]|nr:MAG: hypothetical protein AUG49_15040 [Catenulispora sp. 13_1_20CM_3_70_7]
MSERVRKTWPSPASSARSSWNGRVDDGEPAVAQCGVRGQPQAAVVRPAPAQGLDRGEHQPALGGQVSVEVDPAGDPAHVPSP